ncbi:MAG: hypothetical protein A2096_12740 [Spirochaetes bacterium GWF1_41_5]|nr:MAG: hypothetical protein A2096_12740 [Spirochaetes bacterium GWF1_41_5]
MPFYKQFEAFFEKKHALSNKNAVFYRFFARLQKMLDNMGHTLFFSHRANLFLLDRKTCPCVLNFSGYDGFRSSVR